jgi:uncharacterized cupredoxin-like copper-binding protein
MQKRWTIPMKLIGVMALLALAGCGPKKVSVSAELSDFKFTPDTFEAPANADVTLTLTNSASVKHEFVILQAGYQLTLPFDADDQGHTFWRGEVEAGQSATFTFTAPSAAGEYQVVCGVPGHAEAGMLGSFTVR